MESKNLKAFILGGSGAVGRELVQSLCESNNWSHVTVIVRRVLEQWKPYIDSKKLEVIQVENLDSLEKIEEWKKLENFSSLFCCLGSRTKYGEDVFVKTDYTYPLWGANICKAWNIPHYSLVSSVGANSNSCFLYMKTKGRVEQDLKAIKLPYTTIHRPGLITDRDNDSRFGEKILSYVPFMDKISAQQIAQALKKEAELAHFQNKIDPNKPQDNTYNNRQMLNFAKNSQNTDQK
ncbi:hypothetical protein PPERSA_08188 [Pseudocohnilembus persalinus]|uniref:NAD(P)-binding domain-containing protein n=1 Tax=Pseudocohnilembus persalinus TaxID=266149 RepID=A0A0V0R3B6_PSEPJ|nr:hypothetical protein PPERSA_08188 [Pseudocohnilembus persalinus]|eukprot:KRX08985.1 hypothetical protein PPERSA_08188 [Pseudocohnilembus persalinus]